MSLDRNEYERQVRIRYLAQRGKLKLEEENGNIVYDENALMKLICKKGEEPLDTKQMEAEPFIYSKDINKVRRLNYLVRKTGIKRYIDLRNYKACYKVADVDTFYFERIAEDFNIPEKEIRKAVLEIWKQHNNKN